MNRLEELKEKTRELIERAEELKEMIKEMIFTWYGREFLVNQLFQDITDEENKKKLKVFIEKFKAQELLDASWEWKENWMLKKGI